MKVVINKCFGGFGLSPLGLRRLAERKGRPCYFFRRPSPKLFEGEFIPCSVEEAAKEFIWWAFDVPNPNDVLMREDDWHAMTDEQRLASSVLYDQHHLESRWPDRADQDLVAVVEELGAEANGKFSQLAVVEIPDGVEYEIDEYDGREHVAEAHRTWS